MSRKLRDKISHTHVSVWVIELHHNVGRGSHRDLRVAEDLHLIEDECLVPGGVEGVTYGHSFLRLVEERDNGVGIWKEMAAAKPEISNTNNSQMQGFLIGSSLSPLLWSSECLRSQTNGECIVVSNTACGGRCPADWKQRCQQHWQHKAVYHVCPEASKQSRFVFTVSYSDIIIAKFEQCEHGAERGALLLFVEGNASSTGVLSTRLNFPASLNPNLPFPNFYCYKISDFNKYECEMWI